jgi:hemerythrin-like domain-containing protein
MLRDASLISLSHQHQHALALCVLIERAFAASTGGDAEVQARTIVEAFDNELRQHFEVEEQCLFPALLTLPSVHDLIDELIDEHRRMTAMVDSLRTEPDRSAIAEFVTVLRQHVRKEEGVLFEQTQRLLPRERLDDMGEQIAALLKRVR